MFLNASATSVLSASSCAPSRSAGRGGGLGARLEGSGCLRLGESVRVISEGEAGGERDHSWYRFPPWAGGVLVKPSSLRCRFSSPRELPALPAMGVAAPLPDSSVTAVNPIPPRGLANSSEGAGGGTESGMEGLGEADRRELVSEEGAGLRDVAGERAGEPPRLLLERAGEVSDARELDDGLLDMDERTFPQSFFAPDLTTTPRSTGSGSL